MKYLWLDTETTGLSPEHNDIIQFAGMIETDDKSEEFKFECQPFNPENVHPKAIETHGISIEEMMSFPSPEEVFFEFKTLLCKYVNPFDKQDKFILCGQNVGFDSRMMKHFFLKNHDKFWFAFVRGANLDLMTMAIQFEMKMGRQMFDNHKLSTVCKVLGIKLDNAHDALADIMATRQCCMEIWFALGEGRKI